jgi:hypothetical protein
MSGEDELASLHEHWGEAYAITYHSDMFIAVRRDTRKVLTASSASELREKIRADYAARPVPRQ